MSATKTPPRRSDYSDETGNTIETDDPSREHPQNFFRHLLHRMSPSHCFSGADEEATIVSGGCHNPLFSEQDIEDIVPSLLRDLRNEGKLRSICLQKLYRLTDRERKQNRVPIVCTTSFDAIGAIINCVTPVASSADRRQALLLINNLCIPVENKAAILLGEAMQLLLPVLLLIIRSRQSESYLATVILFNLSFLDDGKSIMFTYVPPEQSMQGQEEYRHYAPTDNPISLLRTIESAMKDFARYVVSSSSYIVTDPTSVEGEAIRWSMGLLRNLATLRENAIVIATETIAPFLAIQCLRSSLAVNKDLSLWKRDSLEDACLMLLVHLAKCDLCLETLRVNNDALVSVLESLNGLGGIHETRASALLLRLQGTRSG
jgi:hypothetical protein